jgi:enoyl-CoA hydratase/carnithine racemase
MMLREEGESIDALSKQGPVPTGGAAVRPPDENGLLWIDQDGFAKAFAADADPVETRVMAAAQKPLSVKSFIAKSGTALAGAFEFALSCDLRIAEDGDYLIGLPEADLGLLPGAGGTQRLPRTIGTSAALMHILMGRPLNPREAEKSDWCTKRSAARLSIAQWRLRGSCRRIRRNRSPALNVSSATPRRRRWRKASRLHEISS